MVQTPMNDHNYISFKKLCNYKWEQRGMGLKICTHMYTYLKKKYVFCTIVRIDLTTNMHNHSINPLLC